MNGQLIKLEMNVIKKGMMNEHAGKKEQNIGNDYDDDQGEATEN